MRGLAFPYQFRSCFRNVLISTTTIGNGDSLSLSNFPLTAPSPLFSSPPRPPLTPSPIPYLFLFDVVWVRSGGRCSLWWWGLSDDFGVNFGSKVAYLLMPALDGEDRIRAFLFYFMLFWSSPPFLVWFSPCVELLQPYRVVCFRILMGLIWGHFHWFGQWRLQEFAYMASITDLWSKLWLL